jgi:alkylation response protein AidB-like acyl-CoA dehydrogenase
MAVEYASQRIQFGRPIGSFQAIRHRLAEMLTALELARSTAYNAGWALSEAEPAASSAASMAKAVCGESYMRIAADNIHIHGGIGFTWEHDAHLFYKRALSSDALFGNATYHYERLAELDRGARGRRSHLTTSSNGA